MWITYIFTFRNLQRQKQKFSPTIPSQAITANAWSVNNIPNSKNRTLYVKKLKMNSFLAKTTEHLKWLHLKYFQTFEKVTLEYEFILLYPH